jgi:Flp pilus assembly protein TadB
LAAQKSKRSSRKRRKAGSAPRAVPSTRREERADQQAATERTERAQSRQLGTVGERPPSPFGGVPVSEIAIFAGLVAIVVWLIRGGTVTLIVGLAVLALGVVEVTAREHFSGYRSHTTLLAAIPAVAAEAGLVALVGVPRQRLLLLLVVVPVYAGLFWLLRKRFQVARQARLARPPGA